MKELKLFVWENVLTDYTDGMVCILAKDLDQAKKIFLNKYKDEQYVLDNFFGKPHQVITEPEAFYVCGGG